MFAPAAFSRCGETFAFAQIDATGVPPAETVTYRGRIADAVDVALRAAGLGCSIGGGTGRQHLYIDLALTDLEPALEVTCRALRDAGAPRRTWLMFPDPAMADEWVGVHADTPPPPARA